MSTQLQKHALSILEHIPFDKLYQKTMELLVDTSEDIFIYKIADGKDDSQCEDIFAFFWLWNYVDEVEGGDFWNWENMWELIFKLTKILGGLITEVMQEKYGLKGVYYFDNHPDGGDYGRYGNNHPERDYGLFYRQEEV
ncbi:MAG TPA: hypothetical protein PKI14_07955 [Fervidobacterium sp.]|nr:hypothetical protein [Fervidobacterium sp.]